ncbi:Bin3 family protein [Schizosaccharomyces cryophilus OY26]|uniref:RNA methyltransferase n=1 Tax=Schizosaccharomyces cryophilus (strain OY26 / ATCC MYA-4695 / CBS 11777 / NBRC 106824 / NRRL Y48691) TaxID=653667 RepID=S9XJP4_SCHCR|nr:Bin3 family protein [Schizosaccharomyces cryophilus OY26]EPY53926.1 Bin3 family protein [Schizosaccharomyces cryophilus OY26]
MFTERYGNYQNYYSMRGNGCLLDSRIEALPKDLFKNTSVLDVGCNNGTITTQVASLFSVKYVLGIDIDPTLIKKADKHLEFVASRVGPSYDHRPMVSRQNFYPISSIKKFSRIQIKFQKPLNEEGFPHNVHFRAVDILRWQPNERFHTVLALSVTKWIHLNGLDEGLLSFFKKMHAVLEPDGVLIIEPQSWDSYLKAAKKFLFFEKSLHKIQIRPENFPEILEQHGFDLQTVVSSENARPKNIEQRGFSKRDIFIFRKKSV